MAANVKHDLMDEARGLNLSDPNLGIREIRVDKLAEIIASFACNQDICRKHIIEWE